MIGRCLENGEPFGVVLVRDEADVGPIRGRLADVGTIASIRRAGRYPDGRLDIVTVGGQRFRVEGLDADAEPWLVGAVRLLDEPIGSETDARREAAVVGKRFLRYLDLLQPAAPEDGPEVEIEFEMEVEASAHEATSEAISDEPSSPPRRHEADPPGSQTIPIDGVEPLVAEIDASQLRPDQRHDLLMAAARRLLSADDPTTLSYILTALVQVDLETRQELLEAPDTLSRLLWLDRMLVRESRFLAQHLRPLMITSAASASRRN
jgi:Lon protease-like protein